jgi:hypothetical protein
MTNLQLLQLNFDGPYCNEQNFRLSEHWELGVVSRDTLLKL